MRVTREQIGLPADKNIIGNPILYNITLLTNITILKIDLQKSDATVRAYKIRKIKNMPCLIYIINEDGTTGILVANVEEPALLTSSDLPAEVNTILSNKTVTNIIDPKDPKFLQPATITDYIKSVLAKSAS